MSERAARDLVIRAREIADDLLFPHALEVDVSGVVPRSHLDALARAGLYGLAGPVDAGGLGADPATAFEVIETLASGCLATTFVWTQHHSVVRAVAGSTTSGLRERWLAPLCAGQLRAGIALAGLHAHAPGIVARRVSGGWQLDGTSPWVSGWGHIALLLVVGVSQAAEVVSGLVEVDDPAFDRGPELELVALTATATSQLRVRHLVVPDDRVTSVEPLAARQARDHLTLRGHAALALGIARRCVALCASKSLADELARVRARLDSATAMEMPTARAAAGELAARSALALIASRGSRALLRSDHAQRLAREALFLLVFGSRPKVRTALVGALVSGMRP